MKIHEEVKRILMFSNRAVRCLQQEISLCSSGISLPVIVLLEELPRTFHGGNSTETHVVCVTFSVSNANMIYANEHMNW
jgi:hypothetical protein